MAENNTGSKPGLFNKVSKSIARTKTKMLQNLGKADRTTDDIFKENVAKIEKQQEAAHHLQKEFKNYLHCVKDLSLAGKTLCTALKDTYEVDWTKHPEFRANLETYDLLWNDYLQTMQDSVTTPLNTYLQSFPALKAKAAKRGRKLVDYDNSRHHLDTLTAAKKQDEVKIGKADDDMKQAKRIYEDLNNELHTELPDFYNSRVTFYASLLSSMFNAEFVLHSEIAKSDGYLGDVAMKLGKEYERYTYNPKRPLSKSISTNSGEVSVVNGETPSSPSSSMPDPPTPSPSPKPVTVTMPTPSPSEEQPTYYNEKPEIKADQEPPKANGIDSQSDSDDQKPQEPEEEESQPERIGENLSFPSEDAEPEEPEPAAQVEEPVDVTPPEPEKEASDDENDADAYSTSPSNLPAYTVPDNTLYTVEATHRYAGEDADELSFEAGEIVFVVEFENKEEQDDGWQMGIKKSDNKKGVFPENFTKKI